jgi:methanogenic corrinoid protein MtbC1
VKRWADQGLIACLRTAGGHRRFERGEVERFLRAEARAGAADGVELLLRDADGREIEGRLLAERARRGSWHAVAEGLVDTLTALGQRWEAGDITIYQEHLASERLARALARLGSSLPSNPGAPRCLLACAPGDEHTLGLALVELCLREAGWAVLWSGRATPTEEIAAAVRAGGVRMVALSASAASTDAVALARQAAAVGEACTAAGAILAVGGAGAWPERPAHGQRFRALGPFAAWARVQAAQPDGATSG